jgi:FAD-dependent oxidoreductase domain-containing protein 1
MTRGAAADVVIIGAGVMGCATAVHLLRDEPGLQVTIVEPDTTYTLAATPRASGGVRQLFSCPENIAMSQYALEVIANWRGFAGPDAPDLNWQPNGYLFIGADAAPLQASLEVQLAHRVRAEWLEPPQLAARFPQIAVGDLAGGVLSPDDGWLDPTALQQGMLATARRLGACLRRDRVAGFDINRTRVSDVRLDSGGRVATEAVACTAGCWAADLAASVGMPVPVEPMRRYEYYAEARDDLMGLPFVKDPAGLAARPHGRGISAGLVDFSHPGGFDLSVDHGYFERTVWPALTHRFPALDQLRLRSTTAGLYDQNRLDGNMIIGNRPGRLDNFYLACGFSGHGLMHAPAVGRALTELILYGEYRTIDMTRMEYRRIPDNIPYPETGIR